MQDLFKTYKFRMYPNKEQEIVLLEWVKAARELFNAALEQRRRYSLGLESFNYPEYICSPDHKEYKKYSDLHIPKYKHFTAWGQAKELTSGKADLPHIKAVPSVVLESVLNQAEQAWEKYKENKRDFFSKKRKFRKFPRPPKYKKFITPITLCDRKGGSGFKIKKLNDKKSVIFGFPKMKQGLKVRLHHEIDGEVKTQQIIFEDNRWYLCVSVKKSSNYQRNSFGKMVGIDFGIARCLQLSTGPFDFYNLPDEQLEALHTKIKRFQRLNRKKEKFSHNRQKANQKIAKIHLKMTRIRHYHLKLIATKLAKEFDLIVLEDLKISNMTKSSRGTLEKPGSMVKAKAGLNRKMLNHSFYFFAEVLKNKCEEFGSRLILINPAYTSQQCPKCGHTDADNRTTQAIFECKKCGYKENADYVGAQNILKRGLENLEILKKSC